MSEERQSLLSSPSPSFASSSQSPYSYAGDRLAVDGSSHPAWKTRTSFILVLLTETMERMAFYGLVCNMIMFLNSNPLGWTLYNATFILLLLNGLSYLTAVIGGWLADACLGKFRTVILFFVVYIVGFAFWPLLYPYPYLPNHEETKDQLWCAAANSSNRNINDTANVPINQENCWWQVLLSVVAIAIGYGAVRVNIIPFGAFQVEHEGQNAMRAYFNWFYFCINVGSFLAFGVLGYIQQEVSFFWGFVAPAIALVLSAVVFVAGSCLFVKKPATGSPISTVIRICCEACHGFRYHHRRRDAEILSSDPPQYVPSCIDYAKLRYGGSFHESKVDEIKVLGKIVVVFLSLIPYWFVYYQMQTTFIWQSLHMQLDMAENNTKAAASDRSFNVPPAWLSLFNVVFVLLLLPLLDKVIYPFLDRNGYSPSLRVRILIGMLFSLLSMVVAGGVETVRMDIFWEGGQENPHWQLIGWTYYEAAQMSVFYQLPQYALIGISEIFTSVAGLELAYIYSPRSMQSIIMALYWFFQGAGAIIGMAMIRAFEGVWFTSFDHGNINCMTYDDAKQHCHLNYYFFFAAGVQLFGILLFALTSWGLNVGSTVPVKIQRQGYTIVRPRDEADSSDSTANVRTFGQTRSVNRRQSGNDTGRS